MARKRRWKEWVDVNFREILTPRTSTWEDHLPQVLLTKPAEIVQEACQVLEKHDYPVKKMLKSELYYSSTLPNCVPSTALFQLDSGTCTNCIDCFNLHHLLKDAFQTVEGTELLAPHI